MNKTEAEREKHCQLRRAGHGQRFVPERTCPARRPRAAGLRSARRRGSRSRPGRRRQRRLLERRAERDRVERRAEPSDRRVEVREQLAGEPRAELRGDAELGVVLVHDHAAAGASHRARDRVEVERAEHPQVERPRPRCPRRRARRRLEREVQRRAVADDRHVAPARRVAAPPSTAPTGGGERPAHPRVEVFCSKNSTGFGS